MIPNVSLFLQRFKTDHLKEIAWLFLSNLASIIVGLGLIKIISRIGAVEYGKFALVLSIVPLVSSVIYTPIDQFCQRYYYAYLYQKRANFFFTSILLVLRNIGWCLLLLCISALVIFRYVFKVELPLIYFLMVSCFYIFVFTNAIPFLSLLNTMRLRSRVALFTVGEKFAQLISLVGISFLAKLDSFLVLAVFATLGTVFLFWKLKMVKGRILCSPENELTPHERNPKEIRHQLFSFGLPILTFGVLAWLQTYSERWVIQLTLDLSSVGTYAFMVMIANTSLMIVINSVSQFVGPIIWEKFSDLSNLGRITFGLRFIRLQVWFVGFITAFAAVGLHFIGDWVIRVLGGHDFSTHSKLLPLIFIGIGLFFVGQTLNSVGFGFNQMRKYTMAKVAGAILTVVSYWLGARLWGLSGVAWASVISNSLYVVLTLDANRRIIKNQPPLDKEGSQQNANNPS